MPRIGDGTGLEGMPPEVEGLSHLDGDETETMPGALSPGARVHPMHEGPQRTTHPHGDKGAGGGKDTGRV